MKLRKCSEKSGHFFVVFAFLFLRFCKVLITNKIKFIFFYFFLVMLVFFTTLAVSTKRQQNGIINP